MAWFGREFIAVPEDRKNQLVYKWPDLSIRRYSRALVNADQMALFVKSGKVVATMGPGRHRIDADELPVLGALVDTVTGGNFYRAELYFVSTRELPGVKFGGRLADIVDPASEQVITLRAFGEFALSVREPAELITSLAGTADLTDPTEVQRWCSELLLKSMKVSITQGISSGEWPVLGLSAHLHAVETAIVHQTNTLLYEYGLRIPRMGNFDITLAPEDADRLKRLAKDMTYIRLTGDFQRYAAGELALDAGHGLAKGGGSEAGFLGAALGLNAIRDHTADRSGTWIERSAATPAEPICPSCRTPNPAGGRFCTNCGERLESPGPQHCTSCGQELPPGAKYCSACGVATGR